MKWIPGAYIQSQGSAGSKRQPRSVSSPLRWSVRSSRTFTSSLLSVLRCPSRKSFFPNGKNLSTISYLIRGAGPRSQFTSCDSPACQSVCAPPLGLRHSLGITFSFFLTATFSSGDLMSFSFQVISITTRQGNGCQDNAENGSIQNKQLWRHLIYSLNRL